MSDGLPKPPPPPKFRTGFGYDVHPFAEGRKCILGGVEIPSPKGLLGHSDADVLLHALADALLGAAGLPDIGHFFPNTEERWRGVDSRVLLREVVARLAHRGLFVGNVDLVIVAERPKIAPHLAKIKENLSADLRLGSERIGLKATTNEKLGFVGREEGIAAMATVLIYEA